MRAAAFHCTRASQSSVGLGRIVTCCSTFSGMVWLVPTSRIPRFFATGASPLPAMMCDWKCTASGWMLSMILRELALTRHGSMNRSHGCGSHRQL